MRRLFTGSRAAPALLVALRSYHPANPRNNSSINASNKNNHNRNSGKPRGRGPAKDRYPPACTDLSDPRRRLALLIDGSSTQLLQRGGGGAFYETVLPLALSLGVPVLCRVFAHSLSAEWEAVVPPPTTADGSVPNSVSTTLALPAAGGQGGGGAAPASVSLQLEYFRVERFIPIPIQIQADAQHIHDYRHANRIEGIAYCFSGVDRDVYSRIADELADGQGLLASYYNNGGGSGGSGWQFNQYLLDELGLVRESCVDGRSKDGS